MKIKKLVIGTALVLALGTTTFAFAKVKNNNVKVQEQESNYNSKENSMYDLMEQYGYGDLVQDMKDGNYVDMQDFMNQLSDEDYQKMTDMMKDTGYGNFGGMMGNITRGGRSSMYQSNGRVAGCFR